MRWFGLRIAQRNKAHLVDSSSLHGVNSCSWWSLEAGRWPIFLTSHATCISQRSFDNIQEFLSFFFVLPLRLLSFYWITFLSRIWHRSCYVHGLLRDKTNRNCTYKQCISYFGIPNSFRYSVYILGMLLCLLWSKLSYLLHRLPFPSKLILECKLMADDLRCRKRSKICFHTSTEQRY